MSENVDHFIFMFECLFYGLLTEQSHLAIASAGGHFTLGRENRLHCSEISDRYLLPVSTEIHRSSDLHRHEQ